MGLISEHEAASLAGVSVETIRQFTKFGLLRPEEGQYREVELRTVFRISGTAHTPPQTNSTEPNGAKPLNQQIQVEGGSTPQQSTTPEQTDTKSGNKASLTTTSNTDEQQPEQTAQTTATQTVTNGTSSTVKETANEPVNDSAPGPHQSSARLTSGLTPELTASYAKPLNQQIQVEGGSTPQQSTTPEQTDTKSGDKASLSTTSNTDEQQPEQTAQTTAAQTVTNGTSSTVKETANEPVNDSAPGPHQSSARLTSGLTPELTASYEFIELTRSLREQVEMLRVERDWLKTRLEKFEERTERDQMLLLSQGNSVSKLIQDRPQERSFLARMLPWFNRRLPA